jgi:hypothetical protein
MNNKLDSFNKDKVKCQKCKEYYDDDFHDEAIGGRICADCYVKWTQYFQQRWDEWWDKSCRFETLPLIGPISHESFFKEFINEQ